MITIINDSPYTPSYGSNLAVLPGGTAGSNPYGLLSYNTNLFPGNSNAAGAVTGLSSNGLLTYNPNILAGNNTAGISAASPGSAQPGYSANANPSSASPTYAYKNSSVKLSEKSEALLDNLSVDDLQKALQKPKKFKAERKEITKQVAADLRAAGHNVSDKEVRKAQKKAGNASEKIMKEGQKAQKKIDKAQKKIDKAIAKGEEPKQKYLDIVNDSALRATAEQAGAKAEEAFVNKLADRLNISSEDVVSVYGAKRLAFLHSVETGRAFRRGGFFNSFVWKILRVVGIAAATAFGGPLAGAAVAVGTGVVQNAANGQSFGNILKGAVIDGVTAYGGAALSGVVSGAIAGTGGAATSAAANAGTTTATSTATTTAVNASTRAFANIAGNATSNAVTGFTRTLAYGGSFGDAFKAGVVNGAVGAFGSTGFKGTLSNLAGGGTGGTIAAAAGSQILSSAVPAIVYGRGNAGSILLGGVQAAGGAALNQIGTTNANNNTATLSNRNPFTFARA